MLNATEGGVVVRLGSNVYSGSSISGGAIVENNGSFLGNWNANVLTSGGGLGTISGRGIFSSSITGPVLSIGSRIDASVISGTSSNTPQVFGSTLDQATISGNASITGETTSGKTYGQGYYTGMPEDKRLKIGTFGQSGFQEFADVFKVKSQEKLTFIRDNFFN